MSSPRDFDVTPKKKQTFEEKVEFIENNLKPPMLLEGTNKSMQLSQRMNDLKVPGVSIAIINNGKIETKQWGDIQTAETRLQAGSISKVIAAVVALQLVEEKKIGLDEDVNEIFKRCDSTYKIPYDDNYNQIEKITLRRVLSHTAGLSVPGFKGYPSDTTPENIPTLDQILCGIKPAKNAAVKPQSTPGGDGDYSGGGFQIVQKIIEEVERENFSDTCQRKIFKPLGMESSTFALIRSTDDNRPPISEGYYNDTSVGEWKKGWKIFPESAAAGLWSTPVDLARFVIAVQESSLLKREFTEEVLRQIPNSEYGLGFKVNANEFFHGGVTDGYISYLVGFDEKQQGAIIMTNSANGQQLIDEMIPAIAEAYSWPEKYTGAPKVKIAADIEISTCQKYEGEFEVKKYGDFIKVFLMDNKLCISSNSNNLKSISNVELTPESGNKKFFNADKNFEITFTDENEFVMWNLKVQKISSLSHEEKLVNSTATVLQELDINPSSTQPKIEVKEDTEKLEEPKKETSVLHELSDSKTDLAPKKKTHS